MTTVTYTNISDGVTALAGASMPSSTNLVALLNRRARLAYASSDWWVRYLVAGESRTVTSGVVPFTQGGKDTIDQFLRIHKVYQPFYLYSSVEVEFYVQNDGAHLVGDLAASDTTYVTYKKAWEGPYTNASTSIPGEWADYLIHGILADYYRQDGQNDKAAVEEGFAKEALTQQMERTDIVRNEGVVAHRISTHVSRAFRRS